MSQRNLSDLYRLFREAEQLECQLLCACYNAKTQEYHHRLFPICERAYNRKERRRQACIAAQQAEQAIRDSQDDDKNRFVTPQPKPSSRSLWRVPAQDRKLHLPAHR